MKLSLCLSWFDSVRARAIGQFEFMKTIFSPGIYPSVPKNNPDLSDGDIVDSEVFYDFCPHIYYKDGKIIWCGKFCLDILKIEL